MIELLALEPFDGLAFYREDGAVYAIRAPYAAPALVSEGAVGRAIGEHGFVPVSEMFETRADLVARVTAETRRSTEGLDDDVVPGLLRVAPPTVLQRFLDRVEHELLGSGQRDKAEAVLVAMLTHSLRMESPSELRARATSLLERARSAADLVDRTAAP
ncbi:MAG: hypothetical protein ACHREM_00470 [Polyangiales bacterium]